ncbi:hypothetical protein ACEF17_09860, partial [Streptococcus hyovaginalis]
GRGPAESQRGGGSAGLDGEKGRKGPLPGRQWTKVGSNPRGWLTDKYKGDIPKSPFLAPRLKGG